MSEELSNFNNLKADLAQSSYPDMPRPFALEELEEEDREKYLKNQSILFDFSQTSDDIPGGQAPDVNYKLYLQPDEPTNLDPGYLTDYLSGFNAYLLTDTENIGADTTKAYMAIRGSDGTFIPSDFETWKDWVFNDAPFAVGDTFIPQSTQAKKGIQWALDKLASHDSDALLDFSAHSLGTFVAVQGVGALEPSQWSKIGDITLFNGPDPTESLQKMGLTDAQIVQLGEKVTYYVNPFDMVSMLNRSKPYEEQFGTVKVMVPLTYTNSLTNKGSAHLFGQYQINNDGEILTASDDFHPELMAAGQKLSELNDTYKTKLLSIISRYEPEHTGVSNLFGMPGRLFDLLRQKVPDLESVWENYVKEYNQIIADTKTASLKWDEEQIPLYQEQIRQMGNAATKIELRSELLQTAVQHALIKTEELTLEAKSLIETARQQVEQTLTDAINQAYSMAYYLDEGEVEQLLEHVQITKAWDEAIERSAISALKAYQESMESFSQQLLNAATQLELVDQQNADLFSGLN